ncbi:MAG TPA: lipopolysaccharide biosynthesis protein [Pyrinomonadaceae bacterium]|nr:lipopolysaccharide biosynthesis protein [Pyrinomonadaceae bacterium]
MPQPRNPERHLSTDHLKADLKGRAARGGALAVGSQGVKFFVSMAATAILARLLTPADYGLVGMVAVVTGFVSLFKDMGLSAATIQKEEISHAQVSTLFWVNVAVSVGVMTLTAALAPAVSWFYDEPRLTLITVGYAAGFVAGGLTVQHEALLRRQMRFGALAALEVSALVAGLAAAFVLAWKGAGYWALVANQLVLGTVYAVGVWAVCRWRPGRPARGTGVRSMLAFGGNLTGFNVVNYFGSNLDNLLIGRLWGAQSLGFYAKAYQLLLLPIDQINTPVAAVSVPALSRLTEEPERYRAAYLRILEKLTIMTMPLAAFMIVTSDWLVRFVLGPQWDETARIFMILGFAAFIWPVLNSTGWLFMTQGRTREMLRWGFVDVSMKVASVVAGLPWGATGVAVGIVVRAFLQAPLLFWYVGRKGPVRAGDFYRAVAPPACAFVLTLAALYGLRQLMTGARPLVGLAASFGVTVVATVVALASLPKGRTALQDLKGTFFLLIARRAA